MVRQIKNFYIIKFLTNVKAKHEHRYVRFRRKSKNRMQAKGAHHGATFVTERRMIN